MTTFTLIPRERVQQILGLALPIMGGMLSQNILNLVDTAMVGQLGAASVAAIGIGGFTNFFAISLILGLSAGVQAMAARRIGEGQSAIAAYALNGGILMALAGGIPLGLGLAWFAGDIFRIMVSDPAVAAAGTPYLQVRLLAAFAVGINFSFRGFWNGIKKSHIYMGTLVVMHIINISLNYVLIFGHYGFPRLGTMGAGLASAISVVAGSLIYLVMGWRQVRPMGFLRRFPDQGTLGGLVRISLPNGIQQLFFSAGLLTLFLIIEKIGTSELAAANIIINIMLVGYLPGIALGLAAATLVGQALGRQEFADASSWGCQVMWIGMLLLATIGIPMWLSPAELMGVFIQGDGAAAVLSAGRVPLMITGGLMFLESVGLVLMNALLGAGDSRRVMQVSILLQWGLFLPGAALLVFLGYGLTAVWIANACYRTGLALIFWYLWRQGRWQSIKV
ncbi:MAG: MATE family efflux transporter [Leptospiraceae bacterium]|nr:MATE family efflux transporter [Leptospiraceae bacterium]